MYPHERSLVKQLSGLPFEIVGVNSDDPADALEACKENGLTWRSFQNEGGDTSISDQWRVSGWPTLYLLDAEGKIRFTDIRSAESIDDAITQLLHEMGHDVSIEHEEDDTVSLEKS